MWLHLVARYAMLAAMSGIVTNQVAAQSVTGAPARQTPAATPQSPAPQASRVEFRCPSAGTVVTTKSAISITDWTSLGAEPTDPTLCLRKQGFTTTERYFGIYGQNTVGSSAAELKKAMMDIIAGTRTDFSFRYKLNQGEGWNFEDKWTRVGAETLTIDGKKIETLVFEQTQQNLTRPFKGTAKWWLDPLSGIVLKRAVVSAEPNYPWGEQFEVTKIVSP